MNKSDNFVINRCVSFVIVTLLLSTGLASCGGQTVNMKEAVTSSVSLTDKSLAEDIKLASSATLMKMKGFPDGYIKGVSFPDETAPNLKSIGLDYDGFVVRGVNVLNYEPSGENVELSGLMIFEDGLNRRAGVRFLTKYQVAENGISIQHVSVVPVYTVRPRVEAYVVPFDQSVDQDTISANHTALYGYAVNNAVPVSQLPVGTKDYDVFMFVMDRSSPTSKTIGRISKIKDKQSGFEDATTLLDYNGWKVAVISGEIDPQSSNSLFAKLLHQPGEEAAWFARAARLQGLFGLTVKTQKLASK